ncbi:replication initiation and membrane attachment family protein [Allobacillus halotolerans]|uniref:DnaD domain protein n=1 Tax=Allobacillus halotolerans TaxID=570278 RepID=A0ABS6GM79_9BACI|nr:DnaD domain protein [Allobacillus halotolerans]MBU6080188.1 DnaD domain protein [Allobacillus halotolerans]
MTMERMKHLLPNDRMKVMQQDVFFTDADSVLTLLYQPLIGREAVALFQFLKEEAAKQVADASVSHHYVMTMLNMDLDEFFEARKRLEAIGLLKTFKESLSYTTFYYLLQRPFSAKGFFADSMYSVLLEHQVGQDVANQLKKKLIQPRKLPDSVQQLTTSFDDVFTTVAPKEEAENPPIKQDKQVEESSLPVDWLKKMLSQQQLQPQSILTQSNLIFMEKMIKIYDVNFLELEKAVMWAVTEASTLDRKEFHAMCKDIYYKKHGTVPPRLYRHNAQSEENPLSNQPKSTNASTPNGNISKKEKLIHHFENITHRQLLEDHSSSGVASMKEIDMITEMMETHGLSQPVMNVLVDYVLKRNQNKLSKNYLETIAAHWSRVKITTAEQAMDIAKREHHMYQQWQQKKQKQTKKSNEVLPKWFKEQKESNKKQPAKQEKSADEIEKDRQELEQFIKSFQK